MTAEVLHDCLLNLLN